MRFYKANKYFKFVLLTALIFFNSSGAWAASTTDEINVNLTVNSCNQNSSCETGIGETAANCPSDCSGGNTGGGSPGSSALKITNVTSLTGATSVSIGWKTNHSAYSTLSWGLTTNYEVGSTTETVPAKDHNMIILGLVPGTKYFFRIEAYEETRPSNTDSSPNNTFTTLSIDLPPTNPTSFSALYQPSGPNIRLSWINPGETDFDVVRILRSTQFFPTSPSEGLLIYEGSATSFIDANISSDTTYYYTIFARDFGGNYSSGSLAQATVPKGALPDKDVPPPDGDIITPPGTTNITDIFDKLPRAENVPPEIGELKFKFNQAGRFSSFVKGAYVELDSESNFTVTIPYESMPEVLKTIAVTMRHPKDPNKSFSFLLRVDADKTEYGALLAPLLDPGEYLTTIYLLDHKYNRLLDISGTVIVRASQTSAITNTAEKVAPIASIVGVTSGLVQVVLATSKISSLYDLYLIVARFFGTLFGFLGLRRRHRPWGTVYDAVTKRPLDPAYVVVKKDGKEIADAITDLDGRYGFLLPEGGYQIEAGKTHYQFPTKLLAHKESDELYGSIYHGEEIVNTTGEVITRNIPLDPVDFDWNEFVKSKQALFRIYSRRDKIKTLVLDILYAFGFTFTLFSTVVSPGLYNYVTLSLYIILFTSQVFWRFKYKAIKITNAATGEPYSFAIVRVFLAYLNQEVKKVVADEFGRFYILVSPGLYYITIDAKKADGDYHRVYKSPNIELPKGVLKDDIIIGDTDNQTERLRFIEAQS